MSAWMQTPSVVLCEGWPLITDNKHCPVQILAEMHKERSHRDLKPQNIIVTQTRMTNGIKAKVTVRLVDFGASREHGEGMHCSTLTSCNMTWLTSQASACTRLRSCETLCSCMQVACRSDCLCAPYITMTCTSTSLA